MVTTSCCLNAIWIAILLLVTKISSWPNGTLTPLSVLNGVGSLPKLNNASVSYVCAFLGTNWITTWKGQSFPMEDFTQPQPTSQLNLVCQTHQNKQKAIGLPHWFWRVQIKFSGDREIYVSCSECPALLAPTVMQSCMVRGFILAMGLRKKQFDWPVGYWPSD